MIALQVDGVAALPTEFCYPEMALSSARSGMDSHRFRIEIEESEFLAAMASPYANLVRELRADDLICGSPQDELARADYPPLAQVLEAPHLLDLVVGVHLAGELLAPRTWDGVTVIRYWLDEIEHASHECGNVVLHGTCYSCGDAVKRPLPA